MMMFFLPVIADDRIQIHIFHTPKNVFLNDWTDLPKTRDQFLHLLALGVIGSMLIHLICLRKAAGALQEMQVMIPGPVQDRSS